MTDAPDDGVWLVQIPDEVWREAQITCGRDDPRDYLTDLLRDTMRLQALHLVGDEE